MVLGLEPLQILCFAARASLLLRGVRGEAHNAKQSMPVTTRHFWGYIGLQTLLWRKNRQSAVHAKKSIGFKGAGNKVQEKLKLDKFGTQWGSLNGRQWYVWPVPPPFARVLSPATPPPAACAHVARAVHASPPERGAVARGRHSTSAALWKTRGGGAWL